MAEQLIKLNGGTIEALAQGTARQKVQVNSEATGYESTTGGLYVPRQATGWDFTVSSFTTDNTWKVDSLDLSSIVTSGATGVIIRLRLIDNAAGSVFRIRTNSTGVESTLRGDTQVANISVDNIGIIAIDSDRLLDYRGSNLTFTKIDVAVLGWFI